MIKYFKFYLSFIVVLTISTTNSMLLFAQENNSDEIKEENFCENNDELEFSNLYSINDEIEGDSSIIESFLIEDTEDVTEKNLYYHYVIMRDFLNFL